METLIETNEQLSKAMSQHQRAILGARKAAGLGTGTPTPPPVRDSAFAPPPPRTESGFVPPPGPPPSQTNKPAPIITSAPVPTRKAVSSKKAPQIPPPGDYAPNLSDDEDEAANPFSDPHPAQERSNAVRPPFPEDRPPVATGQFNDRLGIEPYHPGFRETQSYVGRQDSSLGKVTMHAGANDSEHDEVEEEEDSGRSGYGAVAGAKAPVYRY